MIEVKQIVIGYVDNRGENRRRTMVFTDERLYLFTLEEIRKRPKLVILNADDANSPYDRLAVVEQLNAFERLAIWGKNAV